MSQQEVLYSCGQCGFPLKLCSSDRSVVGIGADYLKQNKAGRICFLNYDESRFKLREEVKCGLYYHSKTSWKLGRLRTKLYCAQCEASIGYVNGEAVHSPLGGSEYGESPDHADSYIQTRFWVKIRALQPDLELEEFDPPSMTGGKDVGYDTDAVRGYYSSPAG